MAQWLDRVKFGNGHDGSPAVSGTINSYASCTGTATQTSLTTTLAANAGDVILIHQSQGTGAGQWEINYVLADAGATLTLAYPLAYSYATGAQAILVPQYIGGTLSGDVTETAWNGSIGGIIALMSSGELTISGSLIADGGFLNIEKDACRQGNSSTANGGISTAANGMAGGGGEPQNAGGGGGNGTAGGKGGTRGAGGTAGSGGAAGGNAELTSFHFGGAGGSADNWGSDGGGKGGTSGGGIFIFSKSLIVTGSINTNGGDGAPGGGSGGGGGGAGAGGSILIKCQTATLGTSKVTANAGAFGTGSGGNGGTGGVGRIRIDYSDTISGTTTPTLSSAQDTTLKSQVYSGMI